MRKVYKSVNHHESDREEAEAILDEVLDHLESIGMLNDRAYARSKVKSFVRKGVPTRGIERRLMLKGVDRELIRECLQEAREGDRDLDLLAACTYVRKRRLGPYRFDPIKREDYRVKDLAKMGRAGFSYGIAKRLLALDGPDDVELLAQG